MVDLEGPTETVSIEYQGRSHPGCFLKIDLKKNFPRNLDFSPCGNMWQVSGIFEIENFFRKIFEGDQQKRRLRGYYDCRGRITYQICPERPTSLLISELWEVTRNPNLGRPEIYTHFGSEMCQKCNLDFFPGAARFRRSNYFSKIEKNQGSPFMC